MTGVEIAGVEIAGTQDLLNFNWTLIGFMGNLLGEMAHYVVGQAILLPVYFDQDAQLFL